MISKTSKLKRVVDHKPRQSTPDDSIYLKLGAYVCPHCTSPGRKRHFPHLLSLIKHIRYQHVHRGTLTT